MIDFELVFVVLSLNYKEIPAFIDFAQKHNAYALIWETRNTNCSSMFKNFEEYA